MICGAPDCKQEIKDGDRIVSVALTVNWGAQDLRAEHAKTIEFHAFGCAALYLAEKAADHDGVVLVEGRA